MLCTFFVLKCLSLEVIALNGTEERKSFLWDRCRVEEENEGPETPLLLV